MKSDEITVKVKIIAVEVLMNPDKRWWQFWKKSIIERPFSINEMVVGPNGSERRSNNGEQAESSDE